MKAAAAVSARRCLGALSVAAIVVTAGGIAGCGATSSSTSDRVRSENGAAKNEGKTLSRNGLTLRVPAGWQGESFTSVASMSVFRVGSFAFPNRRDDDVGQIARAAMGPDDVLINIVDFTAVDSREGDPYTPVTAPLTVDGAEAMPQEGYTVPAAVVESVRLHGHTLYVSVAFGKAPPSAVQVASANEVLRTLDT
jgi:hypothetical protein